MPADWLEDTAGAPALVSGTAPRRVVAIEARPGPEPLPVDRAVDYLVIAHPTLLDAVEPLAEFHRGRGLRVQVVDVNDAYDRFNDGVVHPRAIRDLIRWTFTQLPPPALRYVLLVGDASWDLGDQPADDANYANMTFDLQANYGRAPVRAPGDFRFGRRELSAYDDSSPAGWRNLIPTWDHRTIDGPAASDNWFADVEGVDLRPEVAIGRWPVTTAEEVSAIVAKTVAAAKVPTARRALFVTDNYPNSRDHADRIADQLEASGFATRRIYPDLGEGAVGGRTAEILDALDEGLELVYFVGHGGRFEWRTGRPDLAAQTDLFTLADLDELAPQDGALPVVTSVACYSAPFDHPSADSIGEKLLRMPKRGAAAVIAAAWRIIPSVGSGKVLMEEYLTASTVGEAFLAAKRRTTDYQFITQFNLLGDPALPLRMTALSSGPRHTVGSEMIEGRGVSSSRRSGARHFQDELHMEIRQ